jgi:hypothetical protein
LQEVYFTQSCDRLFDRALAIALPEDITQILTMKHSDWLRLQSEGERLCATLRQHNYQCHKQTRRLSWKLTKEGQVDYILAWLPTPISDWTLIPNDTSPQREQLWQLIEDTLTSVREEVMKMPKCTSQTEDYSRPWAIIRLLPEARRYTVARFFNRQDAEDHRRFLNRFMPAAEFEVLFDVPNEQLQCTTDPEEGSNQILN